MQEKYKPLVIFISKILEIFIFPITLITALYSKFVALVGYHNLPISRFLADKLGFRTIDDHFNMPMIRPERNLIRDLTEVRSLPGIHLNESGQLALLKELKYGEEIANLPIQPHSGADGQYHFSNPMYGSGDAELLYSMIRHLKPSKMIEIGSGYSTLIAIRAFDKNKEEESKVYEITSIEPYANPWLERTKSTVVRERVELVDRAIFSQLEANDILFIDSSHMIRPQGDVLAEILEILPLLKTGVIVHIHDIFTPFDYPPHWIIDRGRLWNEQYLVEAFLSCNPSFEIIAALNFLSKKHPEKFAKAAPVYAQHQFEQPRALWLRKK
ncbi:MAG: class I SAM-dependent methyltransferase [Saprospiraceae bacterium]